MKQEYPKWVYSRSGSRIVKDQAEHAALPPGWYASPADIPSVGASDVADAVASAPAAQVTPGPTVPELGDADGPARTEADSLYAANAATVISKLEGSSEATLLHVQSLEAANPKGARKGVMKAIEAKLKALAAAVS